MLVERERRDMLHCGIAICAASLLVCAMIWPLPLQAKIFPLVMDVCIGAGGLILALSGLRKPSSPEPEKAQEQKSDNEAALEEQRQMPTVSPVIIMLFMAACFLVMPHLGFALTTPLLVFGLLYLAGIRRWLFMIVLTLILEILVFVGFRLILYISIPAGIFDPTEYLFRLFGM